MALKTLPAPLTAAEIEAKIISGELKVTRLAPKGPRRADLIISRPK